MQSYPQLRRLVGEETWRLLCCYKGESPFAVIYRAVKMLAIADHKLTPDGRPLTEREYRRTTCPPQASQRR